MLLDVISLKAVKRKMEIAMEVGYLGFLAKKSEILDWKTCKFIRDENDLMSHYEVLKQDVAKYEYYDLPYLYSACRHLTPGNFAVKDFHVPKPGYAGLLINADLLIEQEALALNLIPQMSEAVWDTHKLPASLQRDKEEKKVAAILSSLKKLARTPSGRAKAVALWVDYGPRKGKLPSFLMSKYFPPKLKIFPNTKGRGFLSNILKRRYFRR